MSWSSELYIGETRPWPDTVRVIRGKTEETLCYVPEKTCHNVGDEKDFCCSECGVRMFIESDDTYTMIASDELTVIKRPNFCPNCRAKVMDG